MTEANEAAEQRQKAAEQRAQELQSRRDAPREASAPDRRGLVTRERSDG